MSKWTLSIVIPLYNEGASLQNNVGVIRDYALAANPEEPPQLDIYLIDDGSTDSTWREIEALCGDDASLTGIRFSRNFGKEAAVCAGLERARGDAVIVIDGDLQHPPEAIPEMVRLWHEESFEVVNAVKKSRGREEIGYFFGAKLFTLIMTKTSGLNFDGACDFKLLDRKVVNAYIELKERLTFYRGLVAWLGFRQTDIPIHVQRRENGSSHWTLPRLIRLAITALTTFSTIALHGITLMGLIVLLVSTILGAYTFYRWFDGHSIEGFTTVILLQLIIGSIVMVGLGILGEYLSTIFHEIKARPRYIVTEISKVQESGGDH